MSGLGRDRDQWTGNLKADDDLVPCWSLVEVLSRLFGHVGFASSSRPVCDSRSTSTIVAWLPSRVVKQGSSEPGSMPSPDAGADWTTRFSSSEPSGIHSFIQSFNSVCRSVGSFIQPNAVCPLEALTKSQCLLGFASISHRHQIAFPSSCHPSTHFFSSLATSASCLVASWKKLASGH